MGLAVVALIAAGVVSAFVSANTIDEHATYKHAGAQVRVTGPIGCTPGERISIRVTVAQPAAGARTRNDWKSRCTGELQHWQVRARARPGTRFGAGRGRVCAVATTREAGPITHTRKWWERVQVSGGFR